MFKRREFISSLKQIILLTLCLLGSIAWLKAQNQTFIHYTTRDGLNSGYVWDMFQDSKGFIWIGTLAGLVKYDSYSFTNYISKTSDPNSISGMTVKSIRELDTGKLVVCSTKALDIFDMDREIFKKVIVPSSMPELTDLVDVDILDNGDIWAASQKGLYHIPSQDLDVDTLQARFFPLKTDTTDSEDILYISMKFDGDTSIWIGSDSYVHQFDLKNQKFVEIGPFNEEVENLLKGTLWEIHRASNGDLLISSLSGLVRWRYGKPEPEVVKSLGPYSEKEMTETGFQSITEDPEGRIWLGTGTLGAILWDLNTNEVSVFRHDPDNPASINSDDVHFAFTDNQNNTWFGYHYIGISTMYSQNWKYSYKLAMEENDVGHPTNHVFSSAEDFEGGLYLATKGGLVYHPPSGENSTLFALSDDIPQDEGLGLLINYDEKILALSGFGNYLYSFDKISKKFTHITGDDSLSLTFVPPAESNENFYFSSFNGRIVVLNKKNLELSFVEIPFDRSINTIFNPSFIFKDSQGKFIVTLFYVQPGRLFWENYILDPEQESLISLATEVPENVSLTAPPSPSLSRPGIIWMRLNTGILKQNILTGESSMLFQSDIGVISESEGVILEDEDGYLWMSNQTGIMRLDPDTESITNYEVSQNPRVVELEWIEQLQNGDIIFMGRGGFIQFDPDDLEQEDPIEKIYITDLFIGKTRYDNFNENSEIRIDHANNNLAFSFIGLNYRDPGFVRYRYRLEGYEEDWNNVGTQRSIFLANLPPGRYNFIVQAATRFGPFNDASASAQFSILPPWWQTLPAYFGYGVIFIGLIFSVDRVRRTQLVRKERERTREKELEQAREIEKAYNDLKTTQYQLIQAEKMASLGELTAGIAHEIQNPLNFINNFSEVNSEILDEIKEELEKGNIDEAITLAVDLIENEKKIMYHGKRADSIVKGMLLHSRGSSGVKELIDINALVDEYLRLAFHGMRAKDKSFNADYKTELDDTIGKISVVPQDIGRVLLNLINNAFYAVAEAQRAKVTAVAEASRSVPEPVQGSKGGKQTGNRGPKTDYKPLVIVSTNKLDGKIDIRVKDNGMGIPKKVRDKIFQPFFTTKPTGEGTGLGLSMSYEIIKKGHEGTLRVKSEEGKGTEFIIELPLK